jgi:CheY-like chemotaxis protein
MPKGGRLTIVTANRHLDEDYCSQHADVAAGDYAMVQVSDTGAGMAADVIAQIFDPFFTTKRRGEGTGLGLSMVFGFMKQSGGHINVYSEPGVGTTFRLYLPRDPNGAGTHEGAMVEASMPGGGETVLVVEDNPALRRVVVLRLTGLGYKVLEAENAEAALVILAGETPIDLVFADVVMPGKLDGHDLARIVPERWPATKVLLTSGFPGTQLDRAPTVAADTPLLNKPYRKDELARALREALGKAHNGQAAAGER